MITALHLITGLERGGAEGALARFVMALDKAAFRSVVVSLRDGGVWVDDLRAQGVDVRSLGFNAPQDALRARARLGKMIREIAPNILQSWLYHADLLATLTPRPATTRLIWSLRNSDLSASRRTSWKMLTSALARLSATPDVIVSNSSVGLEAHQRIGYRPRRSVVIRNGVDTEKFAPSARDAARRRLSLPSDFILIGMPARFDSFKDHATFLAAAKQMAACRADVRFVLAGSKITNGNAVLMSMIGEAGLMERISLLGDVADIPSLYAALDIVTLSSSHGEGFPNVIAEGMACARPVVASDVGDARVLIGDAGRIVPARSSVELAHAWMEVADMSSDACDALGQRARARIVERFSLAASVQAYVRLYRELCGSPD